MDTINKSLPPIVIKDIEKVVEKLDNEPVTPSNKLKEY
jgi:hypothetical protein